MGTAFFTLEGIFVLFSDYKSSTSQEFNKLAMKSSKRVKLNCNPNTEGLILLQLMASCVEDTSYERLRIVTGAGRDSRVGGDILFPHCALHGNRSAADPLGMPGSFLRCHVHMHI